MSDSSAPLPCAVVALIDPSKKKIDASADNEDTVTTRYPESEETSRSMGAASTDGGEESLDVAFEKFLSENEPDLIAQCSDQNPDAIPEQEGTVPGNHVVNLSQGATLAIKNYEDATGKKATIDEIEKDGGLVHWATLGMKMGSKDKRGFHQRFHRALTWDAVAKQIWAGLPENEQDAFKANWATHGDFEFCTNKKIHTNSHEKATQHIGEMKTIYAIGNELGGWHIPACQKGAFRYAAMCLKVSPDIMASDKNWSGLRMFRWNRNLATNTSLQSWRTEVENATSERQSEWQDKADLNRAKIAFATTNGKLAPDNCILVSNLTKNTQSDENDNSFLLFLF